MKNRFYCVLISKAVFLSTLVAVLTNCGDKKDKPAPVRNTDKSEPTPPSTDTADPIAEATDKPNPVAPKTDKSEVAVPNTSTGVEAADQDNELADGLGYEEYCNLKSAAADAGSLKAKLTKPYLRTAHILYEHMVSKIKNESSTSGDEIDDNCHDVPASFQLLKAGTLDLHGIAIEDIQGIPPMPLITRVRLGNTSLQYGSETEINNILPGAELLDLSDNLNLYDCYALASFTQLKDLRIGGTFNTFEVTDCNVFYKSTLPSLIYFDVSNSRLSADMTFGFLTAEGSTNLKVLRLSDVRVQSDFTTIDLSKFPNLVALDISGTSLSIKQGTPDKSLLQIKYLDVRANPNASQIVNMFPNLEYLVTSNGTEIVKGRTGLKGLSVNTLKTFLNPELSVPKIYNECSWDDLKSSEKTLEFIDCTGADTLGPDKPVIKGQAFTTAVKNFTKAKSSVEIEDLRFNTGNHMEYLRQLVEDLSHPKMN